MSKQLNTGNRNQKRKRHRKRNKKCYCMPANYQIVKFPSVWSEFRASHQLCDGTIKCAGNELFQIHRPILSAVSPYFKALFINWLSEGGSKNERNTNEVIINDVPGDIFSLILDYAYTGTCKINADNVEQLLPVADHFEVLGVVQLCCQFLLQELTPENCLGIYKFARHYFCNNLETKCRKYIHRHFKKIYCQSFEFRDLDHNELIAILRDDELNVKNEETVFKAIKVWIEVDEEKRKKYLPNMLKCIRYGFIDSKYIEQNIITWELIHNNQACQKILEPSNIYSDMYSRPRIPYEILFAIGGWSGCSPTSFIETYDSRADKWFLSVNTDTVPRAYHAICVLNNLIYVIGGFDGSKYLNTVRCFNPVTKVWQEKACMYNVRCYVSVCSHGGKIYALGGCSNEHTRMSSAERYEPESNQWQMIPPMHRQRSDASAAVLDDKIYVVGGFNGEEIYRSADVFDVEANQWSYIKSMMNPRTGLSLIAYHGCLYAFGGFNGLTRLSSVEKYNPKETMEWEEVTRMSHARSNFATVVLDDIVYVMGGYERFTIQSVECYDPETNNWGQVSPMNLHRSAFQACVISGLPNAKEYSYLSKTKNFGQGQANSDVENLPKSIEIPTSNEMSEPDVDGNRSRSEQ